MFVQNSSKLSAAIHELSSQRNKKNLATMLKTILPSLPRAVIRPITGTLKSSGLQVTTTTTILLVLIIRDVVLAL